MNTTPTTPPTDQTTTVPNTQLQAAPKVLACVDQSPHAQAVTAAAAWAAQRLNAPLELLHVIDRHPETATTADRSGSLSANAQDTLLQKLASADEAHSKAAREQGRVFLNQLREQALAAGAPLVDMRQRHGHLQDTLHEQQTGVRLVVMGRQGSSAKAAPPNRAASLGHQVEQVVRALQRPILAVTQAFTPPQRVLLAFDGSALTRRGVELVASSPLLRGLPIHLLMAGRATADGPKHMDWAQATLQAAGHEAHTHTTPGEPVAVVTQALADLTIDLLVMGAYTHSPLLSLFRRSHTTDLLRQAHMPVLLLR
jgi:nucleotide-binding universal stress UspA family protein